MPDLRHICDICGREGYWSEKWSWYGSFLDLDDGVVLKICSDRCKEKVGELGGPDANLAGLREARGLAAKAKRQRR